MGRGFDPRWGHKETLQSGVSSHLYDSRSVVILSENAVTMSPTPARKRVIAEVHLDEPVNPDGMNAHRPAISRIRTPLDPTVSFEPGQDSGHRRHVRPRATRQLRRSPWPLSVQRVKHGEIAVLEPQCLTDDTVARRERTVQPPQGEDHLIDRIISRCGSIHSCTLLTTRDTESFPHTTPGTATTPGADLPAWRLHSTILRPTYIMSFISIGCGSARCAYRDSPQCLRRNP